MKRYIVVQQVNDQNITICLITRNYEKAQRKAQKITNCDACCYGYVCEYEKELPNRDLIVR